ncbi:SGNH/GDSL hydrolase family protein [Streptomyces sp. SID8379]|uniref:SGNH/GDSL hydrolase family protein n=1 Tax=unclassified Streptomyces TaxID=2593676 RepID=UPI000369F34C|nr:MULTISPECIES: SGNH/GDSL hydrolase family protein [unclassified Streptomyces]MYW70052.1 SGNH/GDSL hydrolase family protein [Streptomyces sp. SID8379]
MVLRAFRTRFAAVAVTSGAALAGLAAPAQATTGPLPYVALGDSYSAASGVLPLDPSASPLCARSTKNYPHVIAERTGAALKDVTCGAAQTKDFAGSQYPGIAPQLDALSADSRLVTLTIGGNDNNTFISTILSCAAAGILSAGQGSPCKNQYGSSFADDIDTKTYPAVKAALQAVRNKAPHARVAVLGYPWIMPPTAKAGCFAKMPLASGDVPYVRDIQTHLNSAVRRAANETGATYVDLAQASEGHDACQASGTRWVEPALFGTNFVPVHPNALGEAAMAERTISTLGLG